MEKKKGFLPINTLIDEKYRVQFFIKKGSNAETYRVKDLQNRTKFLKLFYYAKLHSTQFNSEGLIKEIELLKKINHPNILSYSDSGDWDYEGKRFAYLVLEFISGESIAERMRRHNIFEWQVVKQISGSLLNGLKYLHNLPQPIVHNSITPQNVMLDLSGNAQILKIIDFGHARHFQNVTKVYYREGLNPFYLAPECFQNYFSPQSDIFSVGVLMYNMLFGLPPWFIDFSDFKNDRGELEDAVLNARIKSLKFPGFEEAFNSDIEYALTIIRKSLHHDLNHRFSDTTEMLQALNGNFPEDYDFKEAEKTFDKAHKTEITQDIDKIKKGFSQIGGMDALKDVIYHDVIQALREKELYEKYKLTIPNGMLLYGPPGCGKSFFAEKLSEEVGYNYVEVKPSTLASIYVHGSQEKIAKLFDDARKNAPTILNFEEFDGLVPKRGGNAGSHQAGEVNEFLTQLNNCGKDGIFVIASTNHPGLIDPAVLRAGRIDKLFYVPPPDFMARKAMFKIFLADRPLGSDLDYDELADKTENYVSVDLKLLVDEAARNALKKRSDITQEIFLDVLRNIKPSVGIDELNKYQRINEDIQGQRSKVARLPMGFKINAKNK